MNKHSLIDLLLAYGPRPDGNAMYDEFVQTEAERTGFDPLKIPEDVSTEVIQLISGSDPRSVILTGTAGDGKTYTARCTFQELKPGCWNDTEIENVVPEHGQRPKIRFIKDLSELSRKEREKIFPDIVASFTGRSPDRFVICVNDGQLLSFFRENQNNPDANPLVAEISEMLQSGEQAPKQNFLFNLIHMSRKSHSETIDAIFKKILQHPGWKAFSESAPNKDVNPILINRDILLGQNGNSLFQQRLKDLVEIAAADEHHLPLRHLIILVVNALLGNSQNPNQPLMDADRAAGVTEPSDYSFTDPYSNLFGYNHAASVREGTAAFRALAEIGVGEETTNTIDDTLLDEERSKSLPKDEFYGEPLIKQARADYAEDPAGQAGIIREILRRQRRRLFLTLPSDNCIHQDPWALTRFHYAQRYLDMARALTDGDLVETSTTRMIIRGLNRTLTGTLTETDDKFWLTRPMGAQQGRFVPLLVDHPISWKSRYTRVLLEAPKASGRPPHFLISESSVPLARLELTPSMFEFLCRVAHGSLPGSFGSKCIQDVRTFQIKAFGAIEHAAHSNDQTVQLSAVGLGQDGHLQERPIKILEDT
ncbi:hypothetical protein [Roseovarius ramblicola]|uniref:Uncharacterized protein n=1 Tax=Roseovarius ramblicola TaxID=2022336 RepID=A0ABV5I0C3_9RHOB